MIVREYNTWPFAAGIADNILISTVGVNLRALSASQVFESAIV